MISNRRGSEVGNAPQFVIRFVIPRDSFGLDVVSCRSLNELCLYITYKYIKV